MKRRCLTSAVLLALALHAAPAGAEPDAAFKQQLLDRRARAVQQVIRKALDGRYLLDEVKTHISIGDASYWFFVIGWALLAFGAARLGVALVWPAPGVALVVVPPLVVCIACFVLARGMSGLADAAMQRVFSQFWHEHQRSLRHALKTAHRDAREASGRMSLTEARRGAAH